MRIKLMWRLLCLGVALGLAIILAACNSGGGSSGGGSGDYDYLYRMNAIELSGHTIRWANNIISVNAGNVPGVPAAFNQWASASGGAVGFVYTGGGANVRLRYGSTGGCGVTYISFNSAGLITSVSMIIERSQAYCDGGLAATVTHEAGHAIGFMGHDTTGIMHPYKAGPLTSQQGNMIRLLYSMPPGTDITGKLRGVKVAGRSSKYDSQGKRVYHLVIRKACK